MLSCTQYLLLRAGVQQAARRALLGSRSNTCMQREYSPGLEASCWGGTDLLPRGSAKSMLLVLQAVLVLHSSCGVAADISDGRKSDTNLLRPAMMLHDTGTMAVVMELAYRMQCLRCDTRISGMSFQHVM